MMKIVHRLNSAVAFSFVSLLWALAASAQIGPDGAKIDRLLQELSKPDQPGWERIQEELRIEWSKSGSAAMDLLLQRAREAMDEEAYGVAIDHLTAVTDHAPEFAEAWNMRATAFFRQERWGLALEDVRRALSLNPQHFGALTGLGIILEGLGQDDLALEALRQSFSLNPHAENVTDMIERLERRTEGTDI